MAQYGKSENKGDVTPEEMSKILQSENDILRNEKKKLEKALQQERSKSEKLEWEKNKAIERLSEEWNAKIGADEKNLENINIKNRPQTVAERYENLCSTTWLNAKNSLDKISSDISEDDKFNLLVDVIITGEKVAKEKYMEVTSGIYEMISVHIESGTRAPGKEINCVKAVTSTKKAPKPLTDTRYADVCDSMPLNLRNAIGDFLRRTCDSTDISAITNEIRAKLEERFDSLLPHQDTDYKDTEEYTHAMEYLEASGRVAWVMVTQRPPMTFDKDTGVGEKCDTKSYELYFRSTDPEESGSVIKLYVHPALRHGKTIMVKGRVLVGKK